MRNTITKNELTEKTGINGFNTINSQMLSPLIQITDSFYRHISEETEIQTFLQKGKPIARWGRKATGSLRGTAWLLKGVYDEPGKYSSQ